MPHIIADVPFVKCHICGMTMEMLSSSHLSKKHGISLQEYNDMFPGVATITLTKELSRRESLSKKAKGRPAPNKGVAASEEQRRKQSETMKAKFQSGEIIHWNLGKTVPEDVRKKISASVSKVEFTEEQKDRINEKRRHTVKTKMHNGWNSPLKGRKITGEALLKSRESIKKAIQAKKSASKQEIQTKCIDYNLTIINELPGNRLELKCNVCESIFNFHSQIFRNSKNIGGKICPTCHPRLTGSSAAEKELAAYVKSLGFTIVENDRSLLPYGMELDIVIPDKKIAIEYNGLYLHSEEINHLPKNLENKRKRVESIGMRLIHIMEDEWLFNQEIVKSRLSQILGINSGSCLHARKLTIKPIDSALRDTFLNEHHIQGKDVAKIRYGAFNGDALVAVMTFKPTNFVKGGDGSVLELSRFAVARGLHIPGIASKLFTHFLREHDPESVISYADSRWSVGNVYKALGFVFSHQTVPNYWYFKPNENIRLHRSNFMKHMLVEQGHDPNKSEFEIMDEMGYYRIYDCGNSVWHWSKYTP